MGERGGKFGHFIDGEPSIDEAYYTFAGKFRRYHGESWFARIVDIRTLFFNTRDLFKLSIGLIESWFILGKVKPDVVFLKGGYVGVPIGLIAALRKIPIVTHDSDALPGLANRIVARWALWHATGMPASYYPKYAKHKVKHVGVLVGKQYAFVDSAAKQAFRKQLGLPVDAKILLITGGSLGATSINKQLVELAPSLLKAHPYLHIIHQTGQGNKEIYSDFTNKKLHAYEFLKPMHAFTGASDVVVSRAGANTMAELGVQGKACIIVPNAQLPGGHQLINASSLLEQNAVVVVAGNGNEATVKLHNQIDRLLKDADARIRLGSKFHEITILDASSNLANLLIDAATNKQQSSKH